MIVYLSVFIYFIINILKNKKTKLLAISTAVLLSFKYNMGTDWVNYKEYYNMISLNNFDLQIEKGYSLYSLFWKIIVGINYEMFMGITILICIFILFNKISSKSNNYYFSIYVYIILYLFNASVEPVARQLIAMAIIVIALKYIEQKKKIMYISYVILAAQFHQTAYIFIILYFIDKIKFDWEKLIMIFILMYLLINNLHKIMDMFANVSPIFLKYTRYFGSKRYGATNINIKLQLIKIILSFIYLWIINRSNKNLNIKNNYINNIAMIYCLLIPLQYKLVILSRLQDYLVFFFAIEIANIQKMKCRRILISCFIIFYGLLFYRKITVTELNKYRYSNYKNYFIEYIFKKEKINEKNYILEIERLIENENQISSSDVK